jgi:hypothetical protein
MNNKRPQQGPTPHAKTCGFCNKGQNDVPIMVASNVTNNTICSYCAIIVVQQTMDHMTNVSAAFKQVVTAKPDWFEKDEKTGAISLIDPDSVIDNELNAANESD